MRHFFVIAGYTLFLLIDAWTNAPALSLPKYTEDAVVRFEKQIGGNYITHGTGFMIFDTLNHLGLVISNRHVFGDHDSLTVRFNTEDNHSERFVIRLRRKDGSQRWVGHPDSLVDLATILAPPNKFFRKIGTERIKPLREISLGDELLFIGFLPFTEFAGEEKNYPSVRGGFVSYISLEDIYSLARPDSLILAKNMILADAISMGGNSGSPVFSTPRPGTNRVSLIGIVMGHIGNARLAKIIPADHIPELVEAYVDSLRAWGSAKLDSTANDSLD